jgi:spermidine/putrescine transport system ATP-binding protein
MTGPATVKGSIGNDAAPFVSAVGIKKLYGDHLALKGADLEIREGEFLTLLGPSGCGKTTLLRIIGGFEQANGGELRFRGRNLLGVPPEQRPFNMVFQSYALFPHMNVHDNVAYGLIARGAGKREISQRVAQILELMNLQAFRDRIVTALSGGQQQRVALARALINEPEVLLLDEPLAALDLQLRKRLQDELRAIQARVGTTFVYVTHDQEEALTLSQRIVLMQEGELVQVGTPRDIYAQPHTRFVAEFVGETNVVPCSVVESSGARCTVKFAGGSPWTLRQFGDTPSRPGDDALAILRPEHLRPCAPGEPAPFSAVIEDVVFLGPALRYEARLPDGTPVRIRTVPDVVHGIGETVHLTIGPGEGVVVPDEASTMGERLDAGEAV